LAPDQGKPLLRLVQRSVLEGRLPVRSPNIFIFRRYCSKRCSTTNRISEIAEISKRQNRDFLGSGFRVPGSWFQVPKAKGKSSAFYIKKKFAIV
jgi:hypothetical protein